MTDYVGGTSSAKTLWTGEGYSAFASALATENELTITFIDINNDVKYTHTLTNSKDRVVPSVSPSQGPMAAGPLDEAAKGKFAVLVVSGKIVAVSLVLIAIVFAYDSRWRRKLRRSRKRKSLLSSYMSPDSSFNEFMAGSKYYPMKSSSRIKEEPKVDLLLKEEPYKAMISAAISAPPSRNYSGFEMKRGLISFPVADKPISFDDPRLPSTQDLTFSEVGSVVSVKSERSLDGKIFENVSPVPVANHKRARTSFF